MFSLSVTESTWPSISSNKIYVQQKMNEMRSHGCQVQKKQIQEIEGKQNEMKLEHKFQLHHFPSQMKTASIDRAECTLLATTITRINIAAMTQSSRQSTNRDDELFPLDLPRIVFDIPVVNVKSLITSGYRQ